MTQEIIIYIIIAVAVIIAIRWTTVTIKNAKKGNAKCAGCPLTEVCSSKNKNNCPNNETNKKKTCLKFVRLNKKSYLCNRK